MDLERFVRAQDDGIFESALAEMRAGHKTTHWMWFVFPQVAGLGRSPMSEKYAVADLAEARAYLAHEVLGPRLVSCCRALLGLSGVSAVDVLGPVDAVKLRSSMTLFALASSSESVFDEVLDRFFDGSRDRRTIDLLDHH